ncbi:MAG: efflux RND transporter permease subunit [Gammaproteobacteria bacterium]|nr:efflux RND transporter permease subunit [Gammaproteobacteria bacterium]
MSIRAAIESKLEALGHVIFDKRYVVLPIMLVLVGGLLSQVPKITIDTSNEGFLHEDDPILIQYNNYRAQYGREEMILLAITAPDIFDMVFLERLRDLHRELEQTVPHLDEVNSLINARNTRGEGDRLIVEDLFEDWPKDPQSLNVIRQRALANTTYQDFVLSRDGKVTTIVIQTQAYSSIGQSENVMEGFDDSDAATGKPGRNEEGNSKPVFLTDKENSEAVAAVREIVEKYRADDFVVYIAGVPAVIDKLKRSMQKDMQGFTKLALLMIIVVLFFLFRRLSGVLLPLVVVILSLLSTIALMAASGTAIKLPTQILPSLILAVSVAASVHLLAVFYRNYHETANKRTAIGYAMGHSGLAIIMTSSTTAAGLLSFAASEVSPISDLGRFAGAGVMLSLIYTLILVPVMIAVFPIKHRGGKRETANHPLMDNFLQALGHFSIRHAKPIVAFGLVLMAIAVVVVMDIRFKHDPLSWLPEEWEIRQATELVDTRMGGSTTVEVVIDTGKENGLYEPSIMNRLEQSHARLVGLQYGEHQVSKAVSVVDILKESNRALHENNEAFYRVPQQRDLIAQELFLFENSGSDDLENFVDSQFQQARITLKGPWTDAGTSAEAVRKETQILQEIFGDEVSSYVTGMSSLFVRTLDAAIKSTRDSYLIAVAVITLMMIMLLSDLKLGLVSMIPNLLPIVIALAALSLMKIPLDMFTMLVGSIAIGLAVDDTIHFMHNFRRYHQRYGDVKVAVEHTLMTTGRAIVVTTIVLCLGFFVFMASDMHNVFRFGALVGATVLLALLADLMLAPALMQIMYGKQKNQKSPGQG